jgi:hypothetical protein
LSRDAVRRRTTQLGLILSLAVRRRVTRI